MTLDATPMTIAAKPWPALPVLTALVFSLLHGAEFIALEPPSVAFLLVVGFIAGAMPHGHRHA